jgi:hypothetical protein
MELKVSLKSHLILPFFEVTECLEILDDNKLWWFFKYWDLNECTGHWAKISGEIFNCCKGIHSIRLENAKSAGAFNYEVEDTIPNIVRRHSALVLTKFFLVDFKLDSWIIQISGVCSKRKMMTLKRKEK